MMDFEKQKVITVTMEPQQVPAERVETITDVDVVRLTCPSCAGLITALRPGTKREGFDDATNQLCCQSCGQPIELEEPESEEE